MRLWRRRERRKRRGRRGRRERKGKIHINRPHLGFSSTSHNDCYCRTTAHFSYNTKSRYCPPPMSAKPESITQCVTVYALNMVTVPRWLCMWDRPLMVILYPFSPPLSCTHSHLPQHVTNPLGHHDGQHDGKAIRRVLSCLNHYHSYADGHSYHATYISWGEVRDRAGGRRQRGGEMVGSAVKVFWCTELWKGSGLT